METNSLLDCLHNTGSPSAVTRIFVLSKKVSLKNTIVAENFFSGYLLDITILKTIIIYMKRRQWLFWFIMGAILGIPLTIYLGTMGSMITIFIILLLVSAVV